MTKVNIVFDDFFDDADIIAVPDELVSNIEEIGQEFLHWVYWDSPKEDSDYWMIKDGRKYCVAETVGFLKWLNANYCANTEKAYIIAQNTNYNPEYKIIEF